MEPMTVMGYLRTQCALPGENFIQQWSKLTDADKDQLKAWAAEEMGILGIPVK